MVHCTVWDSQTWRLLRLVEVLVRRLLTPLPWAGVLLRTVNKRMALIHR